jgi:hypothetical protein
VNNNNSQDFKCAEQSCVGYLFMINQFMCLLLAKIFNENILKRLLSFILVWWLDLY